MTPLFSFYTVQISQRRLANELNLELVDITAKSGINQFAPDFNLVMRYKNGLMSEQEYTEAYTIRMRASLRTYPEVWASLLTDKNKAFACYCKPGCYCHRLLFSTMFQKYSASKGYLVNYLGELTKEGS